MAAEAILELTNTAEQIDPADLGLHAGAYTALESVDIRAIEQQVMLLAVAQALLQVINTNVSGLVARDVLESTRDIFTNSMIFWMLPVQHIQIMTGISLL